MKSKNFLSIKLLIALFALVIVGCGHPVQFGLTNVGENFKQTTTSFNNQLDILWVVDNSPSMSPLQNNLTSNFSAAANLFLSKKWDFHMAVTGTDAYKADPNLSGYSSSNASLGKYRDGTDATSHTGVFVLLPTTPNLNNTFVTNATQGANSSADERAFSSFRTALKSPLNSGLNFVRPGAFLAVIILSDEDDFSGNARAELSGNDHDYGASTLDSVQTYIDFLDVFTNTTGAFRRYNVNTIAVLDSACQAQHAQQAGSTIIGQRYIQLSNATNGALGSVCDASYANALSNIAQQIAVLSTQFYLQLTPNPSTIQVSVNGTSIPNDAANGWTYSSAANSILFHGTAIPPQGAVIAVNFLPDSANH